MYVTADRKSCGPPLEYHCADSGGREGDDDNEEHRRDRQCAAAGHGRHAVDHRADQQDRPRAG